MPRPNINKPLGIQAVKGPGAQANAVQVTDNVNGWASVANIPVPPSAENRSFKKPLGLGPVLVNGATPVNPGTPDEVVEPAAKPVDANVQASVQSSTISSRPGPVESNISTGLSFNNQPPKPNYKAVELDWYGAKLSINCLNAVYQPPNPNRGNQGWLMLELPVDEKTGNPPWRPPTAQLGEDGKISVPEFDCIVDSQRLRCQILNIELYDELHSKYVVVLRVLK